MMLMMMDKNFTSNICQKLDIYIEPNTHTFRIRKVGWGENIPLLVFVRVVKQFSQNDFALFGLLYCELPDERIRNRFL